MLQEQILIKYRPLYEGVTEAHKRLSQTQSTQLATYGLPCWRSMH